MTDERLSPLNSPARLREVLHELRAPLGGIRAMVAMLEATDLDARQREIVSALEASAAHLRAIADGVLGAGEDASAATPRPLRAFLDAIALAAQMRAVARQRSFSLHLEDEALAGLAIGTPALRQVIENLIDNALRLAAGQVALVVARRDDGRLQFAVFDDGPGLSQSEAARLIREGGGIEGRAGGAGIGLTICGRIVTQHGGHLEGGPGEGGVGACFTFDWPDGRSAGAGTGATCLVVDDHPASRLVMRTILGAAGYHVVEAVGPAEALAVFGRQRPAVVLSDLTMPQGGGRALIERLAALPPGVKPYIVVASADEVSTDDPLHALIDAQVRKPISVEGVLGAVRGGVARAA